jgi:5'-deoxynucleotidase YfbR-like HD superfamily hydrolase
MPGHDGYYPPEPHSAEAFPSPSNHSEFITPEGYDVSTVDGAEAYLTEIHGVVLPEPGGETDSSTGYHISKALQKEKRAALYAEAGERQNVAEHTTNLAFTTVWKASKERPELDAGKISIMATYHDAIEAYSKDTVVNDEEQLKSKHWRELAGMTLLRRDLGEHHPLLDVLEEYEQLESPEARFVNAMDKVEAYQFALNTKAALQKERWENFHDVVAKALPKAVIDPTAFKLMQEVLTHLGRKWHDWGCMPFDGDPAEIVSEQAVAAAILFEAKLTAYKGARAVVLGFTGEQVAPEGLTQPVLDEQAARNIGVTLLSSRRAQRQPTPPTPPTSPAFGVA